MLFIIQDCKLLQKSDPAHSSHVIPFASMYAEASSEHVEQARGTGREARSAGGSRSESSTLYNEGDGLAGRELNNVREGNRTCKLFGDGEGCDGKVCTKAGVSAEERVDITRRIIKLEPVLCSSFHPEK